MSKLNSFLGQYKSTRIKIRKDQTLFKQGKASQGVYTIKEGILKILAKDLSGSERLITFAKKGDLIGRIQIDSTSFHSSSAVAYTDADIQFVHKADFKDSSQPGHMLSILNYMANQLIHLENRFHHLSNADLKSKVASYLLMLQEAHFDSDLPHNDIKIHLADLEQFTNASHRRIKRVLDEIHVDKVIQMKRGLYSILNEPLLMKIAGNNHLDLF